MKRLRRTNHRSHKKAVEIAPHEKNRFNIYLLFSLIIAGVFTGSIIFMKMSGNRLFLTDVINQGFIKNFEVQNIFQMFMDLFTAYSFWMVFLFIMGFCAISQPIEYLVLFIRGAAIGISISYTYNFYGKSGFIIALLTILPYAFLTSILLVLAVRESVKFSNMFTAFAFVDKNEEKSFPQVKTFFLKFVVLLILSLVASMIDAGLTLWYIRFLKI